MIQALLHRQRAVRARREIAAFHPTNSEQERIRLLLIAMLDFMLLVLCVPEHDRDFEQAWECIELFRQQMETPP